MPGLTPDRKHSFAVSAFNAAGGSAAVTVSAHTRVETAPVLSSVVKTGPGSFRVTAPNLHSAFMDLVVPGVDTGDHPPIPVCDAYAQNDEDCVFDDLDAGHWEVHSLRIVDQTGRSTTYYADGRLQKYGLAAREATSVAGPYRKTTLDFTPLAFDIP